jgi:MFS family permease
MSLKLLMGKILTRFGYRRVLLVNTAGIGVITILFMTVNRGISAAYIVVLAFSLGFASSMQYTCMNTLVFADMSEGDASPASSIASTVQQMSMSFGVAISSLLAAVYLGGENRPGPAGMVVGIHWTLLTLGLMTIAASFIFRALKAGDGAAISQHKA